MLLANIIEKRCPNCFGRGEEVIAYICFGSNPRHETMTCLSCEGTGSLEVYILNRLERICNCKKHSEMWGKKLFDDGQIIRQRKQGLYL